MALPAITTDDYTGLINVSADTFVKEDFQLWIDELYPELVREILSDAAYVEIRDSETLPDKWSEVMSGNSYTDSNDVFHINSGLTSIIRYWLYWFYVSEQPFVNTNTGTVQNYNENSKAASLGNNAAIAAKRYNKAVGWLHSELYPFIIEFQTVKRAVTGFLDIGGGTFRITVDDTYLLESGDTVNIDGQEYVATNVAATTFDIVSTETSYASVSWKPFESYNLKMPVKETVFA